MAYTAPTVEEFLARFPIFGDKDPAYVAIMLTEGSRYADDTWLTQQDYTLGVMYATAHLIATDNSAEGEDPAVGDLPGAIASETFPEGISISYRAPTANAPASAWASFWGSTEYGRRYLMLVRQTKPGVVAI